MDSFYKKNSVPGRISTNTLQTFPSISTGRIISGLEEVLKLEWTKVSSKSNTKVFFPYCWGFKGPIAAKWGGSISLPNLWYYYYI